MAAKYWVGGTGDWNDTAHWSEASGDVGGASMPSSGQDVYFDGNSGAGIATVNVAAVCANINFTGYTGTFAGSSNLAIYGTSAIFDSGATYTHSGYMLFSRTADNTEFTTNGASLACPFGIAANSKLKLMDDVTTRYSGTNSAFLTYSGITFTPNGKKVTYTGLQVFFYQAVTFYDLILDRSASTGMADIRIGNANVVVSHKLTATGYGVFPNRMNIGGFNPAGEWIIQSLNIADGLFANVSFSRITGTGAFGWDVSAMTSIEDINANSGITFPSSVNYYWYGGSGFLGDGSKWFTGSGGTGVNGVIPLAQDDCYFNSSSLTSTGQTILLTDKYYLGKLDFTGVNNSPTLSMGTTLAIQRSLIFDENMSVSGNGALAFYGTGTLDLAGKSIGTGGIYIDNVSKELTLASDVITSGAIGIRRTGTLIANNYNIKCDYFVTGTGCTLNMGNGVFEVVSGASNQWQINSGTTIICGESTIKLTGTLTANREFQGGGKTYYNVENATSGDYGITVTGNNTFNNFKVNAGRKQYFANEATNTFTTFEAAGEVENLITLKGLSAVTNLVKSGGGTITVTYCDVSYTNVTPLETWFAEDSVDSGNNTGWGFAVDEGGYFALMLSQMF